MKCLALVTMVLFLCSAFCLADATDVQRLTLRELWRVGGEDEDVIFGRITDLKMHPDGSVYVANPSTDTVYVLDPSDGQLIHTIEDVGSKPVGVAASPDGFVYVTNRGSGEVTVIDAKQEPLKQVGKTKGSGQAERRSRKHRFHGAPDHLKKTFTDALNPYIMVAYAYRIPLNIVF